MVVFERFMERCGRVACEAESTRGGRREIGVCFDTTEELVQK